MVSIVYRNLSLNITKDNSFSVFVLKRNPFIYCYMLNAVLRCFDLRYVKLLMNVIQLKVEYHCHVVMCEIFYQFKGRPCFVEVCFSRKNKMAALCELKQASQLLTSSQCNAILTRFFKMNSLSGE